MKPFTALLLAFAFCQSAFAAESEWEKSSKQGAFLDITAPTVYVPRIGQLKIGAYDYYSGLAGPPTATHNGEPVELKLTGDHVWSSDVLMKPGDKIVVVVEDKAGNKLTINRVVRLNEKSECEHLVDELRAEIVLLRAEIAALKAKLAK